MNNMEYIQQPPLEVMLVKILSQDFINNNYEHFYSQMFQQMNFMQLYFALKLEDYCFCASNDTNERTLGEHQAYPFLLDPTYQVKERDISEIERISKPKGVPIPRRRRHPLPDIRENLERVLEIISSDSNVVFKARNKGTRGLHAGKSKRRSQYIGVSFNGPNCQTLVNEGRQKRYIATYTSEQEAALAYDFYSIGLHGLKSRTNFEHTGEDLKIMIQSYLDKGVFTPSDFMN